MCTGLQGISLVFFYSTQCVHCRQLLPIFRQLPSLVKGCQFAQINLSVNKTVVNRAQQTITPIKYVPLLILYNNGSPYVEYKGSSDLASIRHFILETYQGIQQKLAFGKKVFPTPEHPNFYHDPSAKVKRIPAWSLGMPKGEDEDSAHYEKVTLTQNLR